MQIPAGCSRYTVELTRPLGLVLEEDGNGGIKVVEVAEGGNGARAELISQGDSLISTSAYVYTRESEYQGNMVKSGEQFITLNIQGEVCLCELALLMELHHGTFLWTLPSMSSPC